MKKPNIKKYKVILGLRKMGLSFREIAKSLEKSVSTIYEQWKVAKKMLDKGQL